MGDVIISKKPDSWDDFFMMVPERLVELLPPDGCQAHLQIPQRLDRSPTAVHCLGTMEKPRDPGSKPEKLGIAHKHAVLCGNARKKPQRTCDGIAFVGDA